MPAAPSTSKGLTTTEEKMCKGDSWGNHDLETTFHKKPRILLSKSASNRHAVLQELAVSTSQPFINSESASKEGRAACEWNDHVKCVGFGSGSICVSPCVKKFCRMTPRVNYPFSACSSCDRNIAGSSFNAPASTFNRCIPSFALLLVHCCADAVKQLFSCPSFSMGSFEHVVNLVELFHDWCLLTVYSPFRLQSTRDELRKRCKSSSCYLYPRTSTVLHRKKMVWSLLCNSNHLNIHWIIVSQSINQSIKMQTRSTFKHSEEILTAISLVMAYHGLPWHVDSQNTNISWYANHLQIVNVILMCKSRNTNRYTLPKHDTTMPSSQACWAELAGLPLALARGLVRSKSWRFKSKVF